MADLTSLGPLRKRYRGYSIAWTFGIIAACLIIGGALVIVPAAAAIGEVLSYGSSRLDNALLTEDLWVPVAFGLIILAIGIGVAVNWALAKHRAVAVHERGIAFYAGREVHSTLVWDDALALTVAQKYAVATRSTTYTYTVHLRDQQTLSFTSGMAHAQDVVAICQQEIENRLGPAYQARLRQGERATFGLVALDREAVYIGPYATPWREVRGITVNTSSIVVQKRQISAEAPQSAPLDRVPNWWIFVKLARQFVGA